MKHLYRVRVRENGDETARTEWVYIEDVIGCDIAELRREAEQLAARRGVINPKADAVMHADTGKGVKVTMVKVDGVIRLLTRAN